MPRSRVRPLVFATLAVLGATTAAFAGCIPGYTFGEGAGAGDDGGGRPDGSVASDASLDAAGDDDSSNPTRPLDGSGDSADDAGPVVPFDGGIVSVALVDAGSKINATGYGYQLHFVYAANDKSYWFFYIDDTVGEIKTLHSSNLVTWVGGAAIPVTGVADGYTFSVAYANLGGHDVVHLVINESGSGYTTYHVRATISGGALSSATPIALPNATNGGACPNDGPATTVTPEGRVYDVTAWNDHGGDPISTTCDTDIYLASGADQGASWNAGTFLYDGYYVSLPDIDFSHNLVDMPDAGTVMLLYTDYDEVGPQNSASDFASIGWALSPTFDGGAPDCGCGVEESASYELFTSYSAAASYNDWSSCRLTDGDIHVIRHVLNSAGTSLVGFEEDIYDGANWQPTSNPPASSNSISDTGIALVSGADPSKGMLLVTIGIDSAINVARWTTAGGWTTVGKLPGGANPRQSLAGSGCGSAHPMVFWTESIGPANEIESADLSGFLQ